MGFDGCVILNRIEFLETNQPGIYRVGSGFRFNKLGMQCSNEGFTGLEFAGGIPGTVGGATYMNAGANGQVNFFTSFWRNGGFFESVSG
jgi:UDP-N-acetylmuramate dehydrogenase